MPSNDFFIIDGEWRSRATPDWGRNPDTTALLVYGYMGGVVANANGTYSKIVNGTVALVANTTNYIERDASGVVSVNTLGFSVNRFPMAKVATNNTRLVSYEDWRSLGVPLIYPVLDTEVGVVATTYPYYNIKRYGAVGDGGVNDRLAIQNAITSANNVGGGETVRIPKGTYMTTTAINLGVVGGLTIKGEGGVIAPNNATIRAMTVNGPANNMVFDGLKIIGTFGLGLVLAGDTITVKRTTISGAVGHEAIANWCGALYFDPATNVTVDDCDFYGNGIADVTDGQRGFDIQFGGSAATDSSGIVITRCRCRSTNVITNIGLFNSNDITITHNQCSGAKTVPYNVVTGLGGYGGYGIMLYQMTGRSVHSYTIANNRIRDTQGTGIYLQSAHKGTCTGNKLENVALTQDEVSLLVAGISIASCNDVSCTGNVVLFSGSHGIGVTDDTGLHYGVVVGHNSVRGSVAFGIYFAGQVQDCRIDGNTVRDSGSIGIGRRDNGTPQPVCYGISITNNTVVGTLGNTAILMVACQFSDCSGNNVSRSFGYGIAVVPGIAGGASAFVSIAKNTVRDSNGAGTTYYGIYVNATDILIEGNNSGNGPLATQYGGIYASGLNVRSYNNNCRLNNSFSVILASGATRTGDIILASTLSTDVISSTIPFSGPARISSAQAPTYGPAIAIDAAQGDARITATDAVAFTIGLPSNIRTNQLLMVTIKNATAGALGAATWNAVFKMAAWVQPAAGFSRSIMFWHNGANYVEMFRTPADVPN